MAPEQNSSSRIPRLAADVRYRIVGGQAVIIVQEAGEAIVLNPVGTRVLESIDRGLAVPEIVDDLCEQFEVDQTRAGDDVAAYLRELSAAGVIEAPPEGF